MKWIIFFSLKVIELILCSSIFWLPYSIGYLIDEQTGGYSPVFLKWALGLMVLVALYLFALSLYALYICIPKLISLNLRLTAEIMARFGL